MPDALPTLVGQPGAQGGPQPGTPMGQFPPGPAQNPGAMPSPGQLPQLMELAQRMGVDPRLLQTPEGMAMFQHLLQMAAQHQNAQAMSGLQQPAVPPHPGPPLNLPTTGEQELQRRDPYIMAQ